jgi:hypothetical protein
MTRSYRWLVGFAILAFTYALLGNYVALPGYLRFLERGGTSAAGNATDTAVIIGAAKTILWMYAFNLGAMSLYLFALIGKRSPYLRAGIVLCVVWLGFWSIPVLPKMPPAFYVLLGGGILVAIVAAHLCRTDIPPPLAGFLSATAMLFFAMATWDICGLGSTGRILHPDEVILDRSQALLNAQTTKLMIALAIAWVCLAASRLAPAAQNRG